MIKELKRTVSYLATISFAGWLTIRLGGIIMGKATDSGLAPTLSLALCSIPNAFFALLLFVIARSQRSHVESRSTIAYKFFPAFALSLLLVQIPFAILEKLYYGKNMKVMETQGRIFETSNNLLLSQSDVLIFLSFVVLALIEELFFRAGAYELLSKASKSKIIGAMLSSIVFSLMHNNVTPFDNVSIFFMSLVLCGAYAFGGIRFSWPLHAATNLLVGMSLPENDLAALALGAAISILVIIGAYQIVRIGLARHVLSPETIFCESKQ